MSEQRTPRTDALDNEIKTNPPSDSPTPYRASEYESMAKLARQLERDLAEAVAALREYIDAADETVRGEDGAKAMLRFGDADKAARAVVDKHK